MDVCVGFLETIEKQTEDVDFSEIARIRVLKTHLLGSAQAYWKNYKGTTWASAKEFLLNRYPDTNDYDTYLERVRTLKRNRGEQFCDYATRVEDAYDKMVKESPGSCTDDGVLKDKKKALIAACPEEIKNFIDVTPADMTYAKALKDITCWLERNKQYKLTRAGILKDKNSPVKQVAATVDNTVKSKVDGGKVDPAKNPVKSDASKPKGKKNRHFGHKCYYCKKPNHIALNCRHRIAKDGEASNDTKAGSNPDANDTGSSGASKTGGGRR